MVRVVKRKYETLGFVNVDQQAMCTFCYSQNGNKFPFISRDFKADKGKWIKAKVSLFSIYPNLYLGIKPVMVKAS